MSIQSLKLVRGVFVLIILVLLLLSGCAKAPAPVPPPTQAPTATQVPTATPLPTATVSPTLTAVPTQTSAPTATQLPPNELADAKYFTSGHLSGWRYFIAVEAPKPVEGQYTMTVEESKEYKCEVIPQFPRRLYCTGNLAKVDGEITYTIFDKDNNQRAVFTGKLFIPVPGGKN